jgi:ribokinase
MSAPWIWVVGSTMVDMVTYASRVPTAGETIVGNRFELGFGGKGANQAVMLARLGARVGMVNCLGDDVFASMTIANFVAEGIDVTHVRQAPGLSSGVAPIWVEPDGTNRIIIVAGANHSVTADIARDAIDGAVQVDLVVGQLEIPQDATKAAFDAARRRGARTLLNPAPATALDPELLAVSDWVVPNELEFASLAEQALGHLGDPLDGALLRAVEETIGSRLLITLGARGAVFRVSHEETVLVAPPQVEAVDTTGAGDAFVGAFVFGLAMGFDELVAVRLGCACAASSVTRPGTQKSFPRLSDLGPVLEWAGISSLSVTGQFAQSAGRASENTPIDAS